MMDQIYNVARILSVVEITPKRVATDAAIVAIVHLEFVWIDEWNRREGRSNNGGFY
jgi:hypothetical protein